MSKSSRSWNKESKPRRMQKTEVRYSHEDIARRINEFEQMGGRIRTLREQTTPRGINVLPTDPRNYGPYEPVGLSESMLYVFEATDRGEYGKGF